MHQFGKAYTKESAVGIPPGMPPADYKVWLTFKDALPAEAQLYFNVRIGRGSLPGRVPANEEEKMLWLQTAKRIDLVCYYRKLVQLIELHERAGPTAVGRLLCYQSCWSREPQLPAAVGLMLVTDDEDGDMADLCHDYGINYVVVGRGKPQDQLREMLTGHVWWQ